MSDILLAEGNVWALSGLGGYESKLAEGDHARLDVSLRSSLPSSVVEGIGTAIRKAGVSLQGCWQEGTTLRIEATKKIGFLAIVAVAIAAAIVMVALVLSWKLYKLSPVAALAVGTVWIVLIVGAIAVVIFAWKRGSS